MASNARKASNGGSPLRDGSDGAGASIRRRSSADIMISGSHQRAWILQPQLVLEYAHSLACMPSPFQRPALHTMVFAVYAQHHLARPPFQFEFSSRNALRCSLNLPIEPGCTYIMC